MSSRLLARLRPHAVAIAIAAAAIGIVWTFATVTRIHNGGHLGFPLDDAYIYLTYAKQFGRGQPFTYFPGGGYSAGATSILWPMVLAPAWSLGARGHALVWVSYGLCGALYTATCVGAYRLVRALVPEGASRLARELTGAIAAASLLAIAPFAWTALSGMEVALAAALFVAVALLMLRDDNRLREPAAPSRLLAVALAALALARPEATIVVGLIVAAAVLRRLRARAYAAAAWWLAPLLPLVAWVTANRVLAGHWFPNTGVAKSHFYLPGFDGTYWISTVVHQLGDAVTGLGWRASSPLPLAPLFAALWVIGAVRLVRWTWRDRRVLGLAIVGAPPVLVLAVIASSGSWEFHNYRYIGAGFPLVAVTAACALAPYRWPARWPAWLRRGQPAGGAAIALAFAIAAIPHLRADVALYAQNAVDLQAQVVRIGHYLHDQLPDARVMLHDAGAIAYYGDTRVYDMLGLVTNHQARIANNGPGARFEFLEALPPDRRPTHFAYYPSWMGQNELYGDVLLETHLARPFSQRRSVGGPNMEVIEADWTHVHTAERPLRPHPGWHVADRVDVADVDDEEGHAWSADLGRRRFRDPTARWSVFHREISPTDGLLLDGGRTIRGTSRFVVTIDPTKPAKLIARGGGDRTYPYNDPITAAAHLAITAGDRRPVSIVLPAPTHRLVEVEVDLPHDADGEIAIEVATDGPYRIFHWFVLQPD